MKGHTKSLTDALTDEHVAFITESTASIGAALKEEGSFPNFPEGACYDTSIHIIEMLRNQFNLSERSLKLVEGQFRPDGDEPSGDPEAESEFGHYWIETLYGQIIDPTAGQFYGDTPLAIAYADDECYAAQHKYIIPAHTQIDHSAMVDPRESFTSESVGSAPLSAAVSAAA